MQSLFDGIARYSQDVHGKNQSLFDELATGQSPEVLFLTCADSRVDPSLITQTQPGDIFVCRNAGNIVPPNDAGLAAEGTVASIEYAVKVLSVSAIVICGHADCGAVKGAMDLDSVESLPLVASWLQYADTAENDDVDAAIEANVLAQLENLRTYPFIRDAVASGALELVGCVYDIRRGMVRVFDGKEFVVPQLP